MQSLDQTSRLPTPTAEVTPTLASPREESGAQAYTAANPTLVNASSYWPSYMKLKAEAETVFQEMERLSEWQPNFDEAEFEKKYVDPVWERKAACATLISSASVVTDRDLIAKAFVVAEDMADGIVDKHQGARLMRDCQALLEGS